MRKIFLMIFFIASTLIHQLRGAEPHTGQYEKTSAVAPSLTPVRDAELQTGQYEKTSVVAPSLTKYPTAYATLPDPQEKLDTTIPMKTMFPISLSTKPSQNTRKLAIENHTGHKLLVKVRNRRNKAYIDDQPIFKNYRLIFEVDLKEEFPLLVAVKHDGLHKTAPLEYSNPILCKLHAFRPPVTMITIFYDDSGELLAREVSDFFKSSDDLEGPYETQRLRKGP